MVGWYDDVYHIMVQYPTHKETTNTQPHKIMNKKNELWFGRSRKSGPTAPTTRPDPKMNQYVSLRENRARTETTCSRCRSGWVSSSILEGDLGHTTTYLALIGYPSYAMVMTTTEITLIEWWVDYLVVRLWTDPVQHWKPDGGVRK